DQDNARRREIAARYRAGFAAHPEIRTIPVDVSCESATHLFQIRVAHRDEVMAKLNVDGIFPGVHYRDNTHYRMFSYADGTCPEARRASEEIISLPLHLRLSDADVDRVIARTIEHVARLSQSPALPQGAAA
ncbi:MAG: DegT/DnrJ/EryC1/StrS family aminotransferase, partial [Burkholderiales bacterium]